MPASKPTSSRSTVSMTPTRSAWEWRSFIFSYVPEPDSPKASLTFVATGGFAPEPDTRRSRQLRGGNPLGHGEWWPLPLLAVDRRGRRRKHESEGPST